MTEENKQDEKKKQCVVLNEQEGSSWKQLLFISL